MVWLWRFKEAGMATNPIKPTTIVLTLAAVTAAEVLGGMVVRRSTIPPLFWLGLFRLLQTAAVLWIVVRQESGLNAIGWEPGTWPAGLKKGAAWSMGFGLLAGCAMLVLHLTGRDPLLFLRCPLPTAKSELVLFFLVGGLIAPVAEEICFRGILYTYFRRWGVCPALMASTAIFVGLHSIQGLPLPQIVGGLVFAMAYEITGNLTVPITIHALGNLAIFGLSLL